MTKLGYHLVALAVLAAGIAIMAVLWIQADRIVLHKGSIWGWVLGVVATALPALSMVLCEWWLHNVRDRGRSEASVPWVRVMAIILALLWVGLVLFSFL